MNKAIQNEVMEEEKAISQSFHVKGMDCPSCAATVEKGVEQLDLVDSVEIHYSTQKMVVQGAVTRADVSKRVEALGYELADGKPPTSPHETQSASFPFWSYLKARVEAKLFLLGALLILPGLLLQELLGIEHWVISLFSIGAMISAGYPVYQNAWRSLRFSREININVLMSIAGIGAAIIGAFTEAGMVMVLFLLGEILEGYTSERSRRAINRLMEVVPSEALLVKRAGLPVEERYVAVQSLQVEDHIVVKPGDKIPMDGEVVAGNSSVNQASITGESRPVTKEPGETVFASSINGEGVLEIRVTALAADNTINRLIRMVQQAQEQRAPAQRFVDRFAQIYTPLIVGLAFLVAVLPPLLFGQPFLNPAAETTGWLYRGLTLLVVGCPCALVISTPVSIISAISNAAKHGILVKGGVFLETLNQVKVVAMDKTGTLTRGQPAVMDVRAADCPLKSAKQEHKPVLQAETKYAHYESCAACRDLIAVAAAVENRSEHPLANAVVSLASQLGLLDRYRVEQVAALAGRGIQGRINGSQVVIGSHAYFDAHHPHYESLCEDARKDTIAGLTPIMVSRDNRYLGTISVADQIRSSSREAVDALHLAGVDSVTMLTGDDEEVAKGIANEVGVDRYHAQLFPGDKAEALDRLGEEFGKTAMVGDGINDAPALAAADVGIAIGGAYGGTAQAMETADITLMSDNLKRLAFLMRLSRSTMHTVYFNVSLSILVKAIFFVLVLLGYGTMWMAVFADMGTSLLVTMNGLRLLRRPKPTS